jgi:AcrR family transcriptional regulator
MEPMPDTSSAQPARRGRPPRLSQEEIVRAAREIIVRDGVAALTMRRLAEAVGSAPMGLYHHVANKDELLLLVLDAEAAELPQPELPPNPRDRIVAVARFLHDVLDARPWVLEAITPGDRFARRTLPLAEEMIAGFVACGLDLDDAARAYRSLRYLIAGELMTHHAARRRAAGRTEVNPVTTMGSLDQAGMPTLAALAPRWAEVTAAYDPGEVIEALVDGLVARFGVRD